MIRILKKVNDRFVWFESPITIATHWGVKEFKSVEVSMARLFSERKDKKQPLSGLLEVQKTLNLKYDAEQGRYIVQKQVIHEPTTLYYNSFVLDTDRNVYAELVDDYGNEVFLKIN